MIINGYLRGKGNLEELPFEDYLHGFEIYRTFNRAKQVGENRGKSQNSVKIAHKAAISIFKEICRT